MRRGAGAPPGPSPENIGETPKSAWRSVSGTSSVAIWARIWVPGEGRNHVLCTGLRDQAGGLLDPCGTKCCLRTVRTLRRRSIRPRDRHSRSYLIPHLGLPDAEGSKKRGVAPPGVPLNVEEHRLEIVRLAGDSATASATVRVPPPSSLKNTTTRRRAGGSPSVRPSRCVGIAGREQRAATGVEAEDIVEKAGERGRLARREGGQAGTPGHQVSRVMNRRGAEVRRSTNHPRSELRALGLGGEGRREPALEGGGDAARAAGYRVAKVSLRSRTEEPDDPGVAGAVVANRTGRRHRSGERGRGSTWSCPGRLIRRRTRPPRCWARGR